MATVQDLHKALQERKFTNFEWNEENEDDSELSVGGNFQPTFYNMSLGDQSLALHYSHYTLTFDIEEQPISLEDALILCEPREDHELFVTMSFVDAPDGERGFSYHMVYDPKSGRTTAYAAGPSAGGNRITKKLTPDQWTNLVQIIDGYNEAQEIARTAFHFHFSDVD